MKVLLVLAATLFLANPATAQHSHGSKGPNGGAMEDVAGVHAEILVSGNAVTFNILDEGNKPVPTSGFTGSILVVSGSERETVTLSPVGASAMKAETKKPVVPGSSITLILKTQAGTTGQAKFKN